MSLYVNLAWRNIWRNKKRSIIAMSSVLFAVLIAMVMRSMQLGFYARAIDNVVSFYTGYIQLHAPGYDDEQSIDKSFAATDTLRDYVNGLDHVVFSAPRLETFGLIAGGKNTDGALIIGCDPEMEDRLTNLKSKVVEGRYLAPDDRGILLAEGLARHLGLAVGDEVIVLGQGYHGMSATGKYPILGLVKFPAPDLNSSLAYLPLRETRELTGAYGRLTSLAVMLDSQNALDGVTRTLRAGLGDTMEVLTWEEIMPEMVQFIQMDNASGIIMLVIIYIVIGFGILGTILMMTMERIREFGMLMAVGMKRKTLQVVVVIESVFLTVVGALAGTLISIPIVWYFHLNPILLSGDIAELTRQYGFEPIMPFSVDPWIFVAQGTTVLAIALIASLYPLIKLVRIDPVTAIRTGR